VDSSLDEARELDKLVKHLFTMLSQLARMSTATELSALLRDAASFGGFMSKKGKGEWTKCDGACCAVSAGCRVDGFCTAFFTFPATAAGVLGTTVFTEMYPGVDAWDHYDGEGNRFVTKFDIEALVRLHGAALVQGVQDVKQDLNLMVSIALFSPPPVRRSVEGRCGSLTRRAAAPSPSPPSSSTCATR